MPLYPPPPGPRIPPPLDNTEQLTLRQHIPARPAVCWDSGAAIAPGTGVQVPRSLCGTRADGSATPPVTLHVLVKPCGSGVDHRGAV
jgi:hypothetical protein